MAGLGEANLRQLAFELAVGVCEADGGLDAREKDFLERLSGLLELRAGGQYARLGTPGRALPPAPSPRPTTLPH